MTNPNSEENKIAYRQDRPIRALVIQFASVTGIAVLLLAILGFIIGFTDSRVPYIDSGVISNQWSGLLGGDKGETVWDELAKNDEKS